jgi:hypothetical protein
MYIDKNVFSQRNCKYKKKLTCATKTDLPALFKQILFAIHIVTVWDGISTNAIHCMTLKSCRELSLKNMHDSLGQSFFKKLKITVLELYKVFWFDNSRKFT